MRLTPCLTLLALTCLCHPSFARALCPWRPRSYEREVANGKFVLVMLARGYDDELRHAYPRSGLYRKGSKNPLWTVNWYAFHVHVASDGKHMVVPDTYVDRGTPPGRLHFFANGKLIRSYGPDELVDTPFFLGHFGWWVKDDQLDDTAMTYTVRTEDGNRFVFDITTGEMISGFRWRPWAEWAGAGAAALIVGWALWRSRRLRKANRQADTSLSPAAPLLAGPRDDGPIQPP